jgi:hypothetical protein
MLRNPAKPLISDLSASPFLPAIQRYQRHGVLLSSGAFFLVADQGQVNARGEKVDAGFSQIASVFRESRAGLEDRPMFEFWPDEDRHPTSPSISKYQPSTLA